MNYDVPLALAVIASGLIGGAILLWLSVRGR